MVPKTQATQSLLGGLGQQAVPSPAWPSSIKANVKNQRMQAGWAGGDRIPVARSEAPGPLWPEPLEVGGGDTGRQVVSVDQGGPPAAKHWMRALQKAREKKEKFMLV